MKHRNPKKLAQRIVGIILLTGGNLIATTLYLPEFRYVPELFERLQMYRKRKNSRRLVRVKCLCQTIRV